VRHSRLASFLIAALWLPVLEARSQAAGASRSDATRAALPALTEIDVGALLASCGSRTPDDAAKCRLEVCRDVAAVVVENGGPDHGPRCAGQITNALNALASEIASARRSAVTAQEVAEHERHYTCRARALQLGLPPGPSLDSFVETCARANDRPR
jgi:hypothetical protein